MNASWADILRLTHLRRPATALSEGFVVMLDSAKRRTRHALVGSMRACIASDRIPWWAKHTFVTRGRGLLTVLGIEADETPVESEYGTKFVAGRNGSIITFWVRVRGAYEPVLSEFILRHVQEGDVCVDAGANIGYFSLLFAQRVGPSGKVIAIEAAPDTVRRLRANVELNGASGIVDVTAAACAQEKGEITFYLHPEIDAWSRLSPPAEGDPDRSYMGKSWIPVTVAADTLTSIVGADAERVSFIKLDIEGAEPAVTPQIVGGFSNPRLVVALEARAPIKAALMPFQERGFYVYNLHNDYRWFFERKVPLIAEAAYRDFDHLDFADVLLSRQPLALA
jgi:FkbM family methyltransferase